MQKSKVRNSNKVGCRCAPRITSQIKRKCHSFSLGEKPLGPGNEIIRFKLYFGSTDNHHPNQKEKADFACALGRLNNICFRSMKKKMFRTTQVFLDATTRVRPSVRPFVCSFCVIFKRRLYPFLRVKTKKSSIDIISNGTLSDPI